MNKAPLQIREDAPTVLIVMGMAGSGKTTFVHVSYKHCFDQIENRD